MTESSARSWPSTMRRGGSTVVATLAAAAVLATFCPSPASAAPPAAPKPSPSAGVDEHGSESELGAAAAKAKQTGKRVEVVGQRGKAKSTFANPDGSFTDETTQVPTRARRSGSGRSRAGQMRLHQQVPRLEMNAWITG